MKAEYVCREESVVSLMMLLYKPQYDRETCVMYKKETEEVKQNE